MGTEESCLCEMEKEEATGKIASVEEDRVPHVKPELEASYSATLPPKRTSSASPIRHRSPLPRLLGHSVFRPLT